jgi:hypothetical protein
MKHFVDLLNARPLFVSWLGTISGWFSVETIARAKDWAQLGAAVLAAAVSVCALILTAPKAWSQVKAWLYRP